MVLGARLRELREDQYVSRQDAAEAIRTTDAHIGALERGRTGCRLRDVADLLTIYSVDDESERAVLLGLAEHANTSGWWAPYADVLPEWFETYLGLEQVASVLRTFEPPVVPGLLQTPDYARALISAGESGSGELCGRIERGVELRVRRQEVLYGPRPPHVWAVIDEAVLRRPVGGRATMRAQLRHLIDVCRLPHVTLQILPFHAAARVVVGGSVTLLRLAGRGLPDVVFLEQLRSARYPEDDKEVGFYCEFIDRLVMLAVPATETPAVLLRLLGEGFPGAGGD